MPLFTNTVLLIFKKGSLPKLHLNPYSWSKVSNIIYLDSPVGVGFSYSRNTSAYTTGDLRTAADTHAFLLKWFDLYPEFVSNPFYIAGESYAGIYEPTLTSEVVKGIKVGAKPTINFKGYMVGNGVTDPVFGALAMHLHMGWPSFLMTFFRLAVEAACGEDYYSNSSPMCLEKQGDVYMAISGLNIYDILEPCYHDPTSQHGSKGNASLPHSFQQLGVTSRPLAVRTRMFGRAWPFRAPVKDGIVPLWPQLAESNKNSVPCVENVAGPWVLCTDRLDYYHDAGSMIPYHKKLTTGGYRALIFSGDHDMCVPSLDQVTRI
ncbi:hypothetical protein GQ457_10G015320 [Hibiscus cannabinus]